MAAWPDYEDLVERIDAPNDAIDETAAQEAVDCAVAWIAGRLGITDYADAEPAAIAEYVYQATLRYAHTFYRDKDNPEGVLGSQDSGFIRVSGFDHRAERLLSLAMAVPHA